MKQQSKRVLVLQHVEPENLGTIEECLTLEQLDVSCLRVDLDEAVPATIEGYDGLVVLGGPQSVYEEDKFAFLRAEKALVAQAVEANCPVLGICLGSQILAEVLGAKVRPATCFEIGWREVVTSASARDDSLLGYLPPRFTPLHWHGDIYDLPQGADSIGSSEMTQVQGFAFMSRFYGFLFHMEVTAKQLLAMVDSFPNDVYKGGADAISMLSEGEKRIGELGDYSPKIFRAWARLV